MVKKQVVVAIVVVVLMVNIFLIYKSVNNMEGFIKIGFSTDLSSFASYWGESSLAGAELAIDELNREGIQVELIIEDNKLNPVEGLLGVKKFIEINDVDGIFLEFTPVVLSVAPYISEKDVFLVYGSPSLSPLLLSDLFYKTFWDYEKICQDAGEEFNKFVRIGYLKSNTEFGELCLSGLTNSYPGEIVIEEFDSNEIDFRTRITRFKEEDVGLVISDGFKSNNLNILKLMIQQNMQVPFYGVCGDVDEEINTLYGGEVEIFCYGIYQPSEEFIQKIENFRGRTFDTYVAAALSYIHIKQMANAIFVCGENLDCIKEEMDNSKKEEVISFDGFKNRIADYKIKKEIFRNDSSQTIQL